MIKFPILVSQRPLVLPPILRLAAIRPNNQPDNPDYQLFPKRTELTGSWPEPGSYSLSNPSNRLLFLLRNSEDQI